MVIELICKASLPRHMNGVGIIQFIENAVTTKDNEIMFVSVYFKGCDVGIWDNYFGVAV